MKCLYLLTLCFFLMSCSSGENFNRGYVISKSNVEEPPASEEPELN